MTKTLTLIRPTLMTHTVDVPEADIRQARHPRPPLHRHPDPAKSGQAQIPAP